MVLGLGMAEKKIDVHFQVLFLDKKIENIETKKENNLKLISSLLVY